MVLGFGTGAERTLAGLRRSYERATGKSLVPSSFYDRFTPGLARMFRAVLAQLMNKLASSDVRYGGVLEGFADVLAADATVIKLHRLLARRFPGTRTNSSPAAAKLHLVMSVRGTGAHKVKVTGERAKDHRNEVLDKLLNHFTVFEVEIVGDPDADRGTVTNRCCYRTDTSEIPWKSCETVPYRAAELDAWLQDGGDGLVAALRRTKGGNAMTIIRQDRTATHRVAHSLSASLLKFFPEHEIYSMIPEESPTLVSRLCGGI